MLSSILEIFVILYQYEDVIAPLLDVGSSLLDTGSSVAAQM